MTDPTEMQARIAALEEHIANMLAAQECACGYDNPTDICLGHATVLKRMDALEAENGRLREALEALYGAVCGPVGFAAAVRAYSGNAYPWPALDEAEAVALAAIKGEGE